MIKVNTKDMRSFARPLSVDVLLTAHKTLLDKTGAGNDFLGWVDLPDKTDTCEYERIKAAAEKIKGDSKVLVVIGIGGSYLGARAAIEFLGSPNYNILRKRGCPEIYFAGNNLSAAHVKEIFKIIGKRDYSINITSKSGTTTEPAVAFRIFKEHIENKYGKDEAKKRIYATTDSKKGVLKNIADKEGYESFVIPDNIGGRYSVLTAVGLLPIAVAGIDTDKMLEGAKRAYDKFNSDFSMSNPVWKYVSARNALYNNGFTTEILASYEPSFRFMAEWWKQLFGESEGKENKGIFPASVDLTADLHSMGQYIQQGIRNIFETAVIIKKVRMKLEVPHIDGDDDGLNYLAGKDFSEINNAAYMGTTKAHVDGGVPNICIEIDKNNAASFGELVYFFELACGISGYVLGVNPFDQPGVEEYKKNMFELLGKVVK